MGAVDDLEMADTIMTDASNLPPPPPEAVELQKQPGNIWGDDDSELSELSDEEEDKQRAPSSRSPSPMPDESAMTPEPEEGGDEDDAIDGDEYAEPRQRDKDGMREPMRKREAPKKSKKRKEKTGTPAPVEEEEDVDPAVARERARNARLDQIIKKSKRPGQGRRKNNEDDLEAMNDEEISRLKKDMLIAVERDLEENENGRPAVYKLRMLDSVVDMMQKTTLHESLVENGILDAVKAWLEPLHDRSLPALNVQRQLLSMLRPMQIESSALKSSGLGRIVFFYTKCPRVEPSIKRMASQLVSEWMRPILRRSKHMRDRALTNSVDVFAGARGPRALDLGPGTSMSTSTATGRNHARIPQALTDTFTVAPASNVPHASQTASNVRSQGKMRDFKKKLVTARTEARRL